MIYLELFWAFFKIGLFAIGGGLATVPFLFQLSEETQWFSTTDLVKMIAVSESTPGPLGINMATYTGLKTIGIWGGIIAVLGLVTPMLGVIIALCHFFKHYRDHKMVEAVFQGLRPAVAMMIFGFVLRLLKVMVIHNEMSDTAWSSVGLFVFYTLLTFRFRLHPIIFILFAALVGVLKGML